MQQQPPDEMPIVTSLPGDYPQQQASGTKSDASFTTENSSSQNMDIDHGGDDTTDTENATSNNTNNNTSNVTSSSNTQEFLDALEDVHTRFLLNLQPDSELETPEKIFFQLEQAWWFYEDWICDPAAAAALSSTTNEPTLPRFNHLKPFAMKMFEYSPLLPDVKEFSSLWNAFVQYKRKISNFGCILLNQDCTKLILCQVWNGKSHTFPSGKINQGESGVEAATRETYEETGFDPSCKLGPTRDILSLATTNGASLPWNFPLLEQDALSYQEENGGKRRTCYVCCGVPEDFPFEPVCRKEVSKIDWYPLDNIPKPHYAVGPFMSQLKRWIRNYKKRRSSGGAGSGKKKKKEKTSSAKKERQNNSKPRSRNRSRGRDNSNGSSDGTPRRGGGSRSNTPGSSRQGSRSRNNKDGGRDALVESGLLDQTDPINAMGWSEEEMFQVNEQLLGRKIDYDGNPHQFAEQGFFGGKDPHAFHVVGGTFLNSTNALPPAPARSRLQPLFRQNDADEDEELRPFFSEDGATPWGDVVLTAATTPALARTIPAVHTEPVQRAPGSKKMAKNTTNSQQNLGLARKLGGITVKKKSHIETSEAIETDTEITRRSQATKAKKFASDIMKGSQDSLSPGSMTPLSSLQDPVANLARLRAKQKNQYEENMEFIRNWVAKLPKPRPTPHFGVFRLDAEAIVNKAMRELERGEALSL